MTESLVVVRWSLIGRTRRKIHGIITLWLRMAAILAAHSSIGQAPSHYDLKSPTLASTWDEGLPQGNGMIGSLLWQKEGKLRISLDRADLWDLRPMPDIDQLTLRRIEEQVAKNEYKVIQQLGDEPYEREAAPSKIPGAALEFDISTLGPVQGTRLYIKEGVADVTWSNGARLLTFIHPELPIGWFRFYHTSPLPSLMAPRYSGDNTSAGNSVVGQGLARLGYEQGSVSKKENTLTYHQPGWNGFTYSVHVAWQATDDGIVGSWSITSNGNYNQTNSTATTEVKSALTRGYENDLDETRKWWSHFWNESSLNIPDSIIERQWYLENYKFGCVARSNTPPITLQAVWTADNGNLPPWKGDIHNDLNTQLSYWPAYSGNHLTGAKGFTNWLWNTKPVFEKYTKRFFNVPGLAVPGVTTLDGKDMGGWVQYSYSPTVAGWLGHHFYLEWRYSMDKEFLKNKAYPWIHDVAVFFEQIAVHNNTGKNKLPLSSSPEFFDNSMKAWFKETTNYDLAIIRWTFAKAAELATELDLPKEAQHWKDQLDHWPSLSLDASGGLALAPGIPYPESHRHFSHLMAIHPLGILNYSTTADNQIIDASMKLLEEKGTFLWVGYSFSWQANLFARMMKGDAAAKALRSFATCFCLPNGFHVNGDQCTGKLSSFRYRPFTLEGNFAFAAATQEMLLQSHDGIIQVFPAVPSTWFNASFEKLRAEGAFIVSAVRENGMTREIQITCEKGGVLVIRNPFDKVVVEGAIFRIEKNLITITTSAGQHITLKSK